MAGSELQPILMWEDSYFQFENLMAEHKITAISEFYDLVSEIRGTFVLIINYFQTFPKFSTSTEAPNQTFSALDVLDKCKQNSKTLPNYLSNLTEYLEEAAMEVHTACFITHRSKTKVPKTSSTHETLKGDANASPEALQNRFQMLSNDEETPGPSSTGDTVAPQTKCLK